MAKELTLTYAGAMRPSSVWHREEPRVVRIAWLALSGALTLGLTTVAAAAPQADEASASDPGSDDGSDWLVGESPAGDAEHGKLDDDAKPVRERYPHQVHVDASFLVTRIHYRMSFTYRAQTPDGLAEGRKVQAETTNGLGFLVSAGWTWRFIGVGGEVLQSWGQSTEVHSDLPPEFETSTSTVRPSWTSVAVYADLRPFQRYLSLRPGIGLGGVGLRETGDIFDAEGRFGVVPHISARVSVPLDERFRIVVGAGARLMYPSVWEFGGSLLDWRLGVEMN
jgi:hypothetical protein